eukprot:6852023-Alexandrium_andersonii.AAC.1
MGNILANTTEGSSAPPSCDILIAGFSCDSASICNMNRQTHSECIRNSTGQTGTTFNGVWQYVRGHSPPVIILENVRGFAIANNGCQDNLPCLKRLFKALGYVTCVAMVKGWEFGCLLYTSDAADDM